VNPNVKRLVLRRRVKRRRKRKWVRRSRHGGTVVNVR
jgi:hypothetical protein